MVFENIEPLLNGMPADHGRVPRRAPPSPEDQDDGGDDE